MRPARILLLVVAIVAGGLAAFLATRGDAPAPVEDTALNAPVETLGRVLVARTSIGVGQRLSPDLVEWQDWPEGAIRPEYLTVAALPDAPEALTGTVARFEFFPGEPIRESKLVRSDQGYLSAVLPQGMRAVSIGVSAEAGAGGFIQPNDRVDVVQTRVSNSGEVSETILTNVKVLAIGLRLGEVGASSGDAEADADPQSRVFQNATIATLVLDPMQAETVINAAATGQLSLVLRSVADFEGDGETVALQRSSQSVRVVRYGNAIDIMSGTPEAVSAPAPVNVSPDAPQIPPGDFGPGGYIPPEVTPDVGALQPAPLQ